MRKNLLPLVVASVVASVSASVSTSALAQDLDYRGTAHAHSQPGEGLPRVDPDSPAAIFGAQRQIAISSDAGLSISNTSLSGVDGSTTTLTLLPAIDYFVIDNLSVGGSIGLEYIHAPDAHSTRFQIGPRVGYNVPLSRLFSVWPKLGFSFTSTSLSPPEGDSESNNAIALNLFVPVMLHPATHFFLGFGPALDTDLSGDNKATTIAGRLTIGGWI
jgi:hypothetical protein